MELILAQETRKMLKLCRRTPASVIFIGTQDGYSCTWQEFLKLARHSYSNDCIEPTIALDLVVVFSDMAYLRRAQGKKLEFWELAEGFTDLPEPPCKKITCLYGSGNTLAEIQEAERIAEIERAAFPEYQWEPSGGLFNDYKNRE